MQVYIKDMNIRNILENTGAYDHKFLLIVNYCQFVGYNYQRFLKTMGNLLPLVAVFLAGPAIIALIFYRRGV